MATSLFLCTLEHVLEMTTIQLRAFLEAQHEAVDDGPRMTDGHTDRWMALILPGGFLEVGDGPGLPWGHADQNLQAVCDFFMWKRAPQEMHGAEWCHLDRIVLHLFPANLGGSAQILEIVQPNSTIRDSA